MVNPSSKFEDLIAGLVQKMLLLHIPLVFHPKFGDGFLELDR